jgi:hypothetical protein
VLFTLLAGCVIAQAVSRRIPTEAARVRVSVKSCGICGGQSGAAAGFLRVLRFSLPILIPPISPHLSSIIRAWYNRSNSGRRTKWTQSHSTPRNYSPAHCFDIEDVTFLSVSLCFPFHTAKDITKFAPYFCQYIR